jgi:hypothetical protein
MTSNKINIPEDFNYIAVFLSLACNMNCSYCINHHLSNASNKKMMSGKEWSQGLNRIISRSDLPLTLQGGEPTLHKEFYDIVNNVERNLEIDLLTNLESDIHVFMDNIAPGRLKRDAHYASIRVSYHPEEMDLNLLVDKVSVMLQRGYSIGVWAVEHPHCMESIEKARDLCEARGIDFRTKEFLGLYNGMLYGKYKYPDAVTGQERKTVMCESSELIIGPSGDIFRCHHDLYQDMKPIGHILDGDFQIKKEFLTCHNFGNCNPCDIKIKTNRFQVFGHTSVEIKLI